MCLLLHAGLVQRMKLRDEWGFIINVSALTEQQAAEHLAGGGRFYEATRKTVQALTDGLRSEVFHSLIMWCIMWAFQAFSF